MIALEIRTFDNMLMVKGTTHSVSSVFRAVHNHTFEFADRNDIPKVMRAIFKMAGKHKRALEFDDEVTATFGHLTPKDRRKMSEF